MVSAALPAGGVVHHENAVSRRRSFMQTQFHENHEVRIMIQGLGGVPR
jgi:hypothetical protein